MRMMEPERRGELGAKEALVPALSLGNPEGHLTATSALQWNLQPVPSSSLAYAGVSILPAHGSQWLGRKTKPRQLV